LRKGKVRSVGDNSAYVGIVGRYRGVGLPAKKDVREEAWPGVRITAIQGGEGEQKQQ